MKKLLLVILLPLILASCGLPMQYKRDISSSPAPKLQLKVPEGIEKKAETSFMVALVHPQFETKALMSSPVINKYRKMDEARQSYLETVKKSLLADLDHILLQKKIRVSGPFPTWQEMTFDDKKRAIYTFEPQISIEVTTPHTEGSSMGYKEEGNIIVSGSITLILRESLTTEKLWVKRIDAEEVKKPYYFAAKFKDPNRTTSDMDMIFAAGVTEEDKTDEILSQALSEFYASMGDKIWKHVDPEEWEKYLKQAEDLRKEKRY